MKCPRCSGFCVSDTYLDLSENKHGSWSLTRCLMCGFQTDPVMEANRSLMRSGIKVMDRVRTKAATTMAMEE